MLVSVDELVDYMDIKFTVRQRRAAEYVLAGLQSELEAYLRRTIEVVTATEDYVVANDWSLVAYSSFFYDPSKDTTLNPIISYSPIVTVYTRNSPIISVASLTITPLTSASVTPVAQVENQDFTVHRYGIDVYNAGPNDRVTVTYTSGLAGADIQVFRLLILRAASREMQNMHDDVVGLKDLETRNVAPLQTGFTELELKSVKRWRHHRLAS